MNVPNFMRNWKNPSEYPDAETPLDAWRWEFLRRNIDFRNDYETLSQEELYKVLDEKWGMLCVCHPDEDGSLMTTQDGISIRIRPSIKTIEIEPPTIDVSDPELYQYMMDNEAELGLGNLNDEECYEYQPLKKYEVKITFDVSRQLAPQLEQAKDYLKMRKSRLHVENKRSRIDMYQTYLRVLDAVAVGECKEAIAEGFNLENIYPDYAGIKTVTNWINAANALVKGGYRNI